jgi:hypothetical protein
MRHRQTAGQTSRASRAAARYHGAGPDKRWPVMTGITAIVAPDREPNLRARNACPEVA